MCAPKKLKQHYLGKEYFPTIILLSTIFTLKSKCILKGRYVNNYFNFENVYVNLIFFLELIIDVIMPIVLVLVNEIVVHFLG